MKEALIFQSLLLLGSEVFSHQHHLRLVGIMEALCVQADGIESVMIFILSIFTIWINL